MTNGTEIRGYDDLQSMLKGIPSSAGNSPVSDRRMKDTARGSVKGLVSLFAVSVLTFFGAYLNSTSLDTRSSAAGESMYLFLFPNEVASKKGEVFSVFPKASGPDGKKIGSVTLALRFDPKFVRFESVEPDNPGKTMKALKTSDYTEVNSTGLLKIFYGATSEGTAPLKVCDLPKITFRQTEESAGNLEITLVKEETSASFISAEPAEALTGSSVLIRTE